MNGCSVAHVLNGGHHRPILCVDSRNTQVISGGESGELCLWDLDSSSAHLRKKLDISTDDCTAVCFSKLSNGIVFISCGKEVQIFNTQLFEVPVSKIIVTDDDEVNQLTLNEQEQYLAACDDAGCIKIIDISNINTPKICKTLRNKHTNICSTTCFRLGWPGEIITGGYDCQLIHWNFTKLKCLNMFNMQELMAADGETSAYMVNPPFIHHMSISPDGAVIASGLGNGYIALFDCKRKHLKQLRTLQGHSQGISQVHFIEPRKIVSAGNDNKIILWDISALDNTVEGSIINGGANNNAANGTAVIADSHSCVSRQFSHGAKINWIKPFVTDNGLRIIVADQTSDLTVYNVAL